MPTFKEELVCNQNLILIAQLMVQCSTLRIGCVAFKE